MQLVKDLIHIILVFSLILLIHFSVSYSIIIKLILTLLIALLSFAFLHLRRQNSKEITDFNKKRLISKRDEFILDLESSHPDLSKQLINGKRANVFRQLYRFGFILAFFLSLYIYLTKNFSVIFFNVFLYMASIMLWVFTFILSKADAQIDKTLLDSPKRYAKNEIVFQYKNLNLAPHLIILISFPLNLNPKGHIQIPWTYIDHFEIGENLNLVLKNDFQKTELNNNSTQKQHKLILDKAQFNDKEIKIFVEQVKRFANIPVYFDKN